MFFVIERPPFLKLDTVRARAKAWGEVLRDVITKAHTKEVTAPQVENSSAQRLQIPF